MKIEKNIPSLKFIFVFSIKGANCTVLIAHSQREKQRLVAKLFSTSKCEKSKAKPKLAEAKVETWPLLKHSHSEVEHVPLLLLLFSTSFTNFPQENDSTYFEVQIFS